MSINLDRISKEDAVSIASSLLYTLKGHPQYSTVSELSYLLDYENFLKLVTYYGGMTIRIPTEEEINEMLKVLLLYQYYIVEEMPWLSALKKAGYKEEDSISAKNKLFYLKKTLNSQEIGGRNYE